MKRTYVDFTAEYYDSQDQLLELANEYGLRSYDLKKLYRYKKRSKKNKLREE